MGNPESRKIIVSKPISLPNGDDGNGAKQEQIISDNQGKTLQPLDNELAGSIKFTPSPGSDKPQEPVADDKDQPEVAGDVVAADEKDSSNDVSSPSESKPDEEPPVAETTDTSQEDEQEANTTKPPVDESDFEPSWRKHQDVSSKKRKHHKLRWTLLIIFVVIIAACAYPASRQWILLQSKITRNYEVTIVDGQTHSPISGLSVTLAGQSATTNQNGQAQFNNIRLGKQSLQINQPGYAPVNQNLSLEPWTAYELPLQSLQVIGVRFPVVVHDWLTDKVVSKVTISYQQAKAITNNTGLATLVTPPLAGSKIVVSVSAPGYHEQTATLKTSDTSKETTVKLVPDKLDYFVSNRDGKYSVYSSWLDGTHQSQIISGTGNESANDMSFNISPDNKYAAWITSRNAIPDPAYTSSTLAELFILNLNNAQLTKVTNGPITPIGWIGNRFIYESTDATKPYKDPAASKLMSLEIPDMQATTLATSNKFANNSQIINGQIYYAPNDDFNNKTKLFFSEINPDGTNQQNLVTDRIISSIERLGYDSLQLQDNNGDIMTYNTTTQKSANSTWVNGNDTYLQVPSSQDYVWIAQRDGQSSIILQKGSKQNTLYQGVGVTSPMHWLDNSTLVFRVSNDSGTSDNVISLLGGKAHKISDVSNIQD